MLINKLSTGMLAVAVVAVCTLLFSARAAQAAQLTDITLSKAQYYIEVKLSFDKKPAYDESFRYDPDRYIITLSGCKSALVADKLKQLESTGYKLLPRISVYQGADNVALGCYLNLYIHPFIRYDDTAYYLRFYTATHQDVVSQLADGISFSEKSVVYQGELVNMYLVKVDPQASVQVYSAAADRYDSKTRRRTPSSFARRENAEAVVNGGFFGGNGEHLSTLVEDGIIRATGVYPTRPMIVITEDGRWLIGRFNVNTALLFNGTRLPISAKNYPFESGKVIVYDQTYPIDTLPQNAMFYYLLRNHQLSYYGSDTKGLSLSDGTLLLASDIMPEVNPLKQIPDGTEISLETQITDQTGLAVRARSAIGGAPMLVEEGQVELSVSEDRVKDDIAKSERSRTAVGITKSGTLLIAVVREQEDAEIGGVTLKALAQLLIGEGAWQAMNLDGGGSSAMVIAGQVLNLGESEQRPVSNVLVVKAGSPPKTTSPVKDDTAPPAAPPPTKYTPTK
jgi:exopolysaccharide biosynthesis protein